MKVCNEESLGRLVYLAAHDLRNFAEKVLRPFELTTEQLHLLKNMSMDAGLPQRRIGEIVGKSAANITRILDRLAAKRLVERRDNPEDRRATLVFLTAKGAALVEEVHGVFESFSSDLVQGITEAEQQVVRAALAQMTANVDTMSKAYKKNQ